MAENIQEKELKTFGFTGKLRTGFVTAIMGLMLTAIVFLTYYAIDLNKQIQETQGKLYQEMIKEIKSQVKETVAPSMQKLDSTLTTVDSAATLVKESVNNNRR